MGPTWQRVGPIFLGSCFVDRRALPNLIASGGAHVEHPFRDTPEIGARETAIGDIAGDADAREHPSRDTPEIGSLRLGCAHPCAQTVPRGTLSHISIT